MISHTDPSVAATPQSAPDFKASQNFAESDPVVTPDCSGADTAAGPLRDAAAAALRWFEMANDGDMSGASKWDAELIEDALRRAILAFPPAQETICRHCERGSMSNNGLPLYEQYKIAALAWTDAEAAASLLEDCKSAVLAERMQAHGDIAINRAENLVKASQEWKEHVTSIIEARKVANRCKVEVEYIKMRFQEFMSQEANNRIEAKL